MQCNTANKLHWCSLTYIAFRLDGEDCSDAQLARALRKARPDAVSGISERSLAVYLGQLRRGKVRWWEKRRAALQALVDLTGLDLADLGFGEPAPSGAYEFPSFPALRPLELATESLPDIYRGTELRERWEFDPSFWLDPASRLGRNSPPAGVYWLQVPQGHDLDLLWQRLRAQDHAQCIEVDALDRKILQQDGRNPVVVRVVHALKANDIAIEATPVSSPVLVLSRHCPPISHESPPLLPSFAFRSLRKHFRSTLCGGMRRDLKPDWQETLVHWMVARIQGGDTLLSHEDVKRWLGGVLPYRNIISTPNEFIALCGVLHQMGRAQANRLLDGGGDKLLRAHIGNISQARRFAKAVRHRYLHGSTSWHDPIPPEEWALHLEPAIPDSASVAALVTAMVEEKSLARRRDAKAKLMAASADTVLAEMADGGGLERHDDGSYHMEFPFLADALAADEVLKLVDAGAVAQWSRLYLDHTRKLAVEVALWRRSLPQLMQDVEHILGQPVPPLLQLAAEDAMFWIIGLKLATASHTERSAGMAVLRALAARVLSRTSMAGNKPLTRELQTPDEALTWLTVCWSWSMSVACPSVETAIEHFAWLFPCWAAAEHLFEYAGWQLPDQSSDALLQLTEEAGRAAWSTWWPVAQNVASRLPAVPTDPPAALMPALLLARVNKGCAVEPEWISVAGTSRVMSVLLPDAIAQLDATGKGRIFDALLSALDGRSSEIHGTEAEPAELRLERQMTTELLATSWLARDLIGSLATHAIIGIAGPERFNRLILCLGADDDAVIQAFAQAIPRCATWNRVFRQLLPSLPPGSWQTVVSWLDLYPSDDIAEWLWREDGAATIELFSGSHPSMEYALLVLANSAPDEHVPAVAEALSTTKSSLLRECRGHWASERLPGHGLKLETLVNALAEDEWSRT